MSLTSVLYTASGAMNFTQYQRDVVQSNTTGVATGWMAQPAGNGMSTATAASTNTGILQTSGTYTYGINQQGSYAQGSYSFGTFTTSEQASSKQTYSLNGIGSSTNNVTGSLHLTSAAAQTNSLNCVQSASLTLNTSGSYSSASWDLSCVVMTGSSYLTSTQASTQTGNDSMTNSVPTATYSASNGSRSLSQSTMAYLSTSFVEKGSWTLNGFLLSQISFNVQGGNCYTNSNSSNATTVGTGSNRGGNDSTTWTANSNASFSFGGQGSFTNGTMLSNFSMSLGAVGSYSLRQTGALATAGQLSGSVNTTSYSHNDNFSTTVSLSEQGSYNGSSSGWSFSTYNGSASSAESASDQVGLNSASFNITSSSRTVGSGAVGTASASSSGSYSRNLASYALTSLSTSSSVSLSGPTFTYAFLNKTPIPINWLSGTGKKKGTHLFLQMGVADSTQGG